MLALVVMTSNKQLVNKNLFRGNGIKSNNSRKRKIDNGSGVYPLFPRSAALGFLFEVKWEFSLERCQRFYFTGIQWAMGMPI